MIELRCFAEYHALVLALFASNKVQRLKQLFSLDFHASSTVEHFECIATRQCREQVTFFVAFTLSPFPTTTAATHNSSNIEKNEFLMLKYAA